MHSRVRSLFIMVFVLLLAAALRAQDTALMRDMLHYDEAYYGVDALSLLIQPRLTPFFAENFGRESLWMYVLTPALTTFGATSFALRITAFFVGLLTVAAVFRLGRVLFNWRVGAWSAAALAVLFWHVLASHQAFRALLYPLVGTLAFAALWEVLSSTRKVRTQHIALLQVRALYAAFWFALLAYTYIAARAWIALGGVMIVIAIITQWRSAVRTGASLQTDDVAKAYDAGVVPTGQSFVRTAHYAPRTVLAYAFAFIVFLALIAPLVSTLASNPALANLRGEQVAIGSFGELVDNLRLWAGAWFVRGSEDVAYNLVGRPILDVLLLMILAIGMVAWGWRLRFRTSHHARRMLFLLALFAVSLAPALLTTDTLKPLRAIGVVVPLALLLGVAADAIVGARRWAQYIAPLLLLLAAINTSRDFATWVRSSDLFLPMEQHIMRGIDMLGITREDYDNRVYFSPFTLEHPVLRFHMDDRFPRFVSAFVPETCLRLHRDGADHFAVTLFDPDFALRLSPFAEVMTLATDAVQPPRYAIYHAVPDERLFDVSLASWDHRVRGVSLVHLTGVPDAASAGESVEITVGLQTEIPRLAWPHHQPLPPLTLFAHLYGDPTPYEGGVLWAQVDVPLCASDTWRAGEIILHTVRLTLPDDLPAGRYTLALGMYDTRTLERLPVASRNGDMDYKTVAEIVVE